MMCKVICVNLIFIATVLCDGNSESPGFFLKVAKNVPRLGRRAGADAVQHSKRASYVSDGSTIDEQRPVATWFEHLVQPSKRVLTATRHRTADGAGPTAAATYRKVQPFDSSVLIDLITSASDGGRSIGEDLKFVSWKNFDIALESDTELYRKLEELAQGEADLLAAGHQPIEIDQFVPMDDGPMRGRHFNGDGGMFYRVDRTPNGSERERVEYQM